MAAFSDRITVAVDFVTDGAQRGLKGIRSEMDAVDGRMNKLKAGAKASFAQIGTSAKLAGAGIAIAFGAKAVDAASNLDESINAVRVTFGEAADAILDIGENAAESMGLSKRAFNEAAVSVAGFATTVAGPGGDVAAVIQDLMGRAADFASVMNIDVSEAVSLFASTLAGETEPIRRYGKDVSAATVEHYLLSEGIASSKSEITEAMKVQGRYAILMRDTADVAGDFSDTSDSLANRQKVLAAEIENASAAAGTILIPVIENLAGAANLLIQALDRLPDFLKPGNDEADRGIDIWSGLSDAWEGFTGAVGNHFDEWRKGFDQGFFTKIEETHGRLGEGLFKLGEGFETSTERMDELRQAMPDATTRMDELRAASTDTAEAERNLAESTAQAAERNREHEAAVRANNEALRAAKEEAEAVLGAINAMADAQRAATDSGYAHERAVWETDDAIAALAKTNRDATATERQKREAFLDAADSAFDEADSLAHMRIEQRLANNETVDAAAKNRITADAFSEVANRVGGPVANELRGHAQRLAAIPETVQTSIGVNLGDALTRVQTIRNALANLPRSRLIDVTTVHRTVGSPSGNAKFHEGGIVPGRRGQEVAAVLEAGEMIVPADEAKQSFADLKRGTPSGGGNLIIHIHGDVNDAARFDRKVREAEARWQRRNGPGQ